MGIAVAGLAALLLLTQGTANAHHYYSRTAANSYSFNRSAYTSYTRPAYSTYSSAAAKPAQTSPYNPSASAEQTLLSLLNQERSRKGLRSLQADSRLNSAAEAKSADMVRKGYFSHTSPTYGAPNQLLSRFGVSYRQWAENIGRGSSAARIHAMLMASPTHRANILNPAFTHVGMGVVSGSNGLTATQLFISR